MRNAILAVLAALGLGLVVGFMPPPATAASSYPVCLYDRDRNDCSFSSMGQCMAAASGTGGSCRANAAYAGGGRSSFNDEPAPRVRAKKKRWYKEYY